MAKRKRTTPATTDEYVASRMADLGLDPELPSDEQSQKVRFQQAQRQAEADERKRRRRG